MRKTKVLAVILCAAFMLQICAVISSAATYDDEFTAESPFVPTYLSGSYGEFLQDNARTLDDIDTVITIDVTEPKSSSDNVTIETIGGRENAVVTDETGFVEYTFNVETAGLYVLGIDYFPLAGKGGTIERSILINGKNQYSESRNARLDRLYVDDLDYSKATLQDGIYVGLYDADSQGNETRPSQIAAEEWISNGYFKDSTGSYSGALKFYLQKGENTIRLESVREELAFSSLYFYTISSSRSYSEWLLEYENEGLKASGDEVVAKIQAEYPVYKNNTQLFAISDRSSVATEPASADTKKLNTIGGENWKTIGDWVEYNVDVPEEGLYKLVIRYRQNVNSGMFSSRSISVNGEYPFEENASIQFVYNSDWQTLTPTDEYGDPLLFHFNKGTNTVRIEAVAGEMEEIINAVDSIVRQLQNDYRSIIVLTGNSPDTNQDFELDTVLPDVVSDFKAQGDLLTTIYNKLLGVLGEEGSQTAQLQSVINDLYSWNEDPDSIPKDLSQINNDVSTLGDFVSTCRNQSLELDYIIIAEVDYDASEVGQVGFFENLVHQVKLFFSSFSSNLNSVSGDRHTEYSDYARVWTTASRDYAILMRQVIDRNFVTQYGVDLEVQLFPGVLTSSVLAGDVCDVHMGMAQATIIDYGARNILYPVNFFTAYEYDATTTDGEVTGHASVDGYREVKDRFVDAVWEGVTLETQKDIYMTYGIPETIDFSILFYRTDIIEEYGIPVPDSWDDYYDLIPLLQKYSMEIAAPSEAVMIYQYGGTRYKDSGRTVNFDSDLYLDLFTTVNEFYTLYNCPIEFNAQNRFKSGEMPFLFGTIATWTTLTVFCPEISGLWAMAVTPGVEQTDGSINNVVVPTVTYTVMMMDSKDSDGNANYQNAWKFMQWWASTDAQVEYGREYESINGQTARYVSANTEAFLSAPWSSSEMSVLYSQLQNLRGAEVAVGDYLSARYLEFARNEVIVDGTGDGIDTILEHINEMNKCITNKRVELELPE